jgi:hypothetical protein
MMNALDTPGDQGDQPTRQIANPPRTSEASWAEKVKTIGGLVAVVAGVLVVGVIAIIAMIKNTSTAATIASSAGGVIATVVGAYFGVKVGTDQSKTAIEGQHAEAAKAQVYAAHLPPGDAPDILKRAEEAAQQALGH